LLQFLVEGLGDGLQLLRKDDDPLLEIDGGEDAFRHGGASPVSVRLHHLLVALAKVKLLRREDAAFQADGASGDAKTPG
jgi:hypothetical protein